nr:hypothetical protein [uncultured Agathobaculum sp.]
MREIYFENHFKRDVRRIKRRGLPLDEMYRVISLLAQVRTPTYSGCKRPKP